MDLRQLRYFVGVAQLRSFSGAAAALGIAQPALSRHMQHLEEELGTRLVHRHARGVTLTEAGELLLQRAEQILADVERTKADIGSRQVQLEGSHTLGMPIPVSALLTERLFHEAPLRFPGITLRLVEGFSALLPEWLIGGSIDLAILYAPQHPAIHAEPLLTESLYVAGAAHCGLEEVESCSLEHLAELPLIVPHRPHPLWDLLDRHGVTPRRHISAAAIGIMKQIAAEGKGFMLLPYATVHSAVVSGELVARPCTPALTREVALCHARARPLSASQRAIQELVRDEVQAMVASGAWPGAEMLPPESA